ncbi:MAG: 50S ribosomal protein L6 [Thermoplasmata archaeon]|nr:MAG: 50S ribosomal protein L6 [Thermoplasmata archaeon]
MTKRPDIEEKIVIPEGVEATLEDTRLTIKGEKGVLSREFSHPQIKISISDGSIVISCRNPRRKQAALVGTFKAHIKNMFHGVTNGFEYRMKTVYSHFPIKTMVDGNYFVIQNFLGERHPRKALILEGVSVEIKGDEVIVKGIDKEKVGQTVANIERATIVKNRDVRVFQDGVYRVSKGGS